MNIIETYLQNINEGKDFKDPSLPNPYNYQSIQLDPKVTQSDLKKAIDVVKKNRENFEDVDGMIKDMTDLMTGKLKHDPKFLKSFTIVDKGKRVGYMEFDNRSPSSWDYCSDVFVLLIVWVNGKRYAARAIMKSSSLPFIKTQENFDYVLTYSNHNKEMINTVKFLKENKDRRYKYKYTTTSCISKPFWWE